MDKIKTKKSILKIFLWIVFGSLVVYILLLIGIFILAPKIESYTNRQYFDSQKWKENLTSSSNLKQHMVDDLTAHHTLVGMPQKQIDQLLGKPPQTNYFKEFDYVYRLGPERGLIGIDSEWLGIRFEDSIVVEVKLLTD